MSTLTTYETKLNPNKNALIENINNYLASLIPKYGTNNLQYLKIDLEQDLKITMLQSQVGASNLVGNYARLIQDNKSYYFFITSALWTSKDVIKLHLVLDTINTFNSDYSFKPTTRVIRQHKDRFKNITTLQTGNNTLLSLISKTSEGIQNAPKYLKTRQVITDTRSQANKLWYLVYSSNENPTANNPIKVQIAPAASIPLKPAASALIINLSFTQTGIYYYLTREENPALIFNNRTWDAAGYEKAIMFFNNSGTFTADILTEDVGGNLRYTSIVSGSNLTLSNATTMRTAGSRTGNLKQIAAFNERPITRDSTLYSASIKDVDRTKSSIIKIIELPYCPFELTYTAGYINLPAGFSIDGGLFIAIDVTQPNIILGQILPNNYTINIDKSINIASSKLINRTIKDPKLFNSDFYDYKINYDSYDLHIALEQLQRTTGSTPYYTLEYRQSSAISSNLGFKVSLVHADYESSGDYDLYLIATRNNESPIYTNAYLDYLRNGYNYDRKNQTRSDAMTWGAAVVSLVGAAATTAVGLASGNALAAGAGIGLGITAITTIGNAINNTISNEQSIQQKIESAKQQAASIRASDDVDLLNWYNGNKAYIVTYAVSDELSDLLDDLFYYTGYASNTQETPNTSSRYWFNFLQCEADLQPSGTDTTYTKYLDNIKARYAAGVTIYHDRTAAELPDPHNWDLDQMRENWETGFII